MSYSSDKADSQALVNIFTSNCSESWNSLATLLWNKDQCSIVATSLQEAGRSIYTSLHSHYLKGQGWASTEDTPQGAQADWLFIKGEHLPTNGCWLSD